MSTVDRARENLSTANTRFGNTYRAWQASGSPIDHAAHVDATADVWAAELDLEDALRADGEIS